MSGRVGSITTGIIEDGLIYNFDAANRASYIPNATTTFNTTNFSSSGSLKNDPAFLTPPTSASCWQFDGIDDIIETSLTPELYKTSISVWLKTSKPYTTVNEDYGVWGGATPASHGQGGIGDTEWSADYLYISFQPGLTVTAKPGSTDANHPTAGIPLNDNVWHHCVWTYSTDGSSMDIDAYVDGNNQISYTNRTSWWAYYVKYKKFGTGLSGQTGPFPGEIANIQIHNRKITQTEVLHNYNALKGRFS